MKKDLRFRWIWTSLSALALGSVLVYLIGGWIAARVAGEPYRFMEYYYNFFNYEKYTTGHFPLCREIVIIDAHDSSIGSRSGMADVLNRLSDLQPAVVGMDILYPNTHESTEEEDRALSEAAARLGDRLVMAARMHGKDSLEHSFFTLSRGLTYATVNAQSFFGFTPTDSLSGKAVDKLVFALAKRYTETVPDQPIINYESLSFRRITEPDQISSSLIDGKIVLIGDCQDSKDEVDLPFLVEGRTTLSGVKVNAYQLASLVQPSRALTKLPFVFSFAICFILVFAYGFFVCIWPGESKETFLTIFGQPVAALIVELLALLLLVFIIHWTGKIPNLLPFMGSVPFFGTCKKAVAHSYRLKHPDKPKP